MQLSTPSLPLPGAREADRFQRALDGRLSAAEAGPTLGGYAAVAGRLSELVPTTTLRPSPEYRAELHTRLVELALAQAAQAARTDRAEVTGEQGLAGDGAPARTTPARHRPQSRRERGLLLGWLGLWGRRGWRRTLTASTGALLSLLVGVGFAAGSALPGGLLYPVKELIQSAQLQLAGGGLDHGRVLLDQARGHIGDASTLVGRGSPDPADVDTALRAASDDLGDAQRSLLAQFNRSHDPAALDALARFATSQSPRLAELRSRVPVVSQPLVDQLLRQLGSVATSVRTVVGQCGSPCAAVPVSGLPGPDGLPGGGFGSSGGSGAPDGAGPGSLTSSGSGGVGGLGGVLGGGLGGSGTGGGAGGAGAGGSGGGAGASLGSGGLGVQLPGVGASVPAPGVSAGSGGVRATVPPVHVTVGPVSPTLPGVGVTLPPLLPSSSSSSHPAGSSSSSSVCVLIVCVG